MDLSILSKYFTHKAVILPIAFVAVFAATVAVANLTMNPPEEAQTVHGPGGSSSSLSSSNNSNPGGSGGRNCYLPEFYKKKSKHPDKLEKEYCEALKGFDAYNRPTMQNYNVIDEKPGVAPEILGGEEANFSYAYWEGAYRNPQNTSEKQDIAMLISVDAVFKETDRNPSYLLLASVLTVAPDPKKPGKAVKDTYDYWFCYNWPDGIKHPKALMWQGRSSDEITPAQFAYLRQLVDECEPGARLITPKNPPQKP